MLALRGIPALYFHSLVGTGNDSAGVEQSGHARRINRRKFQRAQLDAQISESGSLSKRSYDGYRHLLAVRRQQPAFHPDAEQRVVDLGDDSLLGFERVDRSGEQSILVVANVSNELAQIRIGEDNRLLSQYRRDLISGDSIDSDACFTIAPGQAVWLSQ